MKQLTIDDLRREVAEATIEYAEKSFQAGEFATFNALTSETEFLELKDKIERLGYDLSQPILIDEDGLLMDGRHRQKALQQLSIRKLPFIQLKRVYPKIVKMEYIMQKHTQRRETKTQQAIKAYKYKKSVLGVSYEATANRFGVSPRMVKSINKLFVLMTNDGLSPDKVFDDIMANKPIIPVKFSWVHTATGSINNLIEQYRDYLLMQDNRDDYDSTDVKKVIDMETGEINTVELGGKIQQINYSKDVEIKELRGLIQSLKDEIKELKK